MKVKLLAALLLAATSTIAIATVTSTRAVNAPYSKGPTSAGKGFVPTQETERVIDGRLTPERIPDHLAYSMLFRMISYRQEEKERRQGRAYIRQIGLEEAQIDALIAIAEEFSQRVAVLGEQANAIKLRTHPNHEYQTYEEKRQLRDLRRQKEKITDDMVASLPHQLGVEGSAKVSRFVREHIKHSIKITERDPD